ncbi:hypothetical protein OROMI_026412 [Orobanche minor]
MDPFFFYVLLVIFSQFVNETKACSLLLLSLAMAAYTALVSLTNTIEPIMTHPFLSTFFDNEQIQSLQRFTLLLLDFIGGYNYGGEISKEVEDLERRIACAAHEAQDAIESHTFVQIHDGFIKSIHGCSVHLQQITQDIEVMLKIANELKEEEERLGLREEEQPTHPTPSIETRETTMLGFQDELIQIMDELTNQQSSLRIISIVGMGGMGKTTLARNVYQNSLINQHFDVRAWATVSQQYNLKDILSQLLSRRGEFSGTSVGELGEQLHKTLYGRRYLIILDDIWSAQAWDESSHFFPDNGSRSRVVLTTRLSNLARNCSSSSFTMKPLDEHTSWKLFCKKAFEQETCPYPELEKVGKEIARLCRGLPLSTVVIGGLLLKSPRSLRFWDKVAGDIKSYPDSKEKEESLHILSLSYSNLPPHLKPCFRYMGVFKEDSEIRVTKIISVWIAEGFLRPNNDHTVEEVGECYLKELIDRNMILVTKSRKNGKMGSCGIHDLMRDLCFKVAKQQECLHSGPSLACSMREETTVDPLISYKFLRVCNEDFRVRPDILYWYVNLRYLAHRPSLNLLTGWKLPTLISLIWNLQTIIIAQPSSWTYMAVVAPIEIWKMRQLRHVKCSNLHLPRPPPSSDSLFVMDNLQTLTTVVNFKLYKEVCVIVPNIKKLRIAYGDEWHGYDDSLMECVRNIGCLHKLESLNLHVPNFDHALHKIVTFPASLNKLSLTGCLLRWEDLSLIGSLPLLEVLELKRMLSNAGKQWSPIDGQFLRLKFLKLNFCDLCLWDADSSNFPVLQRLLLVELWHLEEIPLCVGEIPTLELISVDCCSESASISAVRIKEDLLENQGNDVVQIRVGMHRSDVESFKKITETEGLGFKDIHLEIYSV